MSDLYVRINGVLLRVTDDSPESGLMGLAETVKPLTLYVSEEGFTEFVEFVKRHKRGEASG